MIALKAAEWFDLWMALLGGVVTVAGVWLGAGLALRHERRKRKEEEQVLRQQEHRYSAGIVLNQMRHVQNLLRQARYPLLLTHATDGRGQMNSQRQNSANVLERTVEPLDDVLQDHGFRMPPFVVEAREPMVENLRTIVEALRVDVGAERHQYTDTLTEQIEWAITTMDRGSLAQLESVLSALARGAEPDVQAIDRDDLTRARTQMGWARNVSNMTQSVEP